MIKISQETDLVDASALACKFNLTLDSYCRVYKEEDNGKIIGAGAMNLDKTSINISLNVDSTDFADIDLLFRSMLNVAVGFENFSVNITERVCDIVGGEQAVAKLGFKKQDKLYVVKTKDINFKCSCH